MDCSHPVNKESLRELVIASRSAEGQRVEAAILESLQKHAWDERSVFGVRLALEEALVNAIKHGNRLAPDKRVRVVCRISSELIRVEITDQGEGFDPTTVPDPTDPDRLGTPYGRGVMLIKAFMSRVQYNASGNQVVLEKNRGGRT